MSNINVEITLEICIPVVFFMDSNLNLFYRKRLKVRQQEVTDKPFQFQVNALHRNCPKSTSWVKAFFRRVHIEAGTSKLQSVKQSVKLDMCSPEFNAAERVHTRMHVPQSAKCFG